MKCEEDRRLPTMLRSERKRPGIICGNFLDATRARDRSSRKIVNS